MVRSVRCDPDSGALYIDCALRARCSDDDDDACQLAVGFLICTNCADEEMKLCGAVGLLPSPHGS